MPLGGDARLGVRPSGLRRRAQDGGRREDEGTPAERQAQCGGHPPHGSPPSPAGSTPACAARHRSASAPRWESRKRGAGPLVGPALAKAEEGGRTRRAKGAQRMVRGLTRWRPTRPHGACHRESWRRLRVLARARHIGPTTGPRGAPFNPTRRGGSVTDDRRRGEKVESTSKQTASAMRSAACAPSTRKPDICRSDGFGARAAARARLRTRAATMSALTPSYCALCLPRALTSPSCHAFFLSPVLA